MPKLRSILTLIAVASLHTGCSVTEQPPVPLIGIDVSPDALTIEAGASGEADVISVRQSSTAAVTISVSGGGTGVTAALEDLVVDGDLTTATLTITVSGSAEPGSYTVTVKAVSEGADDATDTVVITVTEPDGGGNNELSS